LGFGEGRQGEIKTQVKSESKVGGQECPPHTACYTHSACSIRFWSSRAVTGCGAGAAAPAATSIRFRSISDAAQHIAAASGCAYPCLEAGRMIAGTLPEGIEELAPHLKCLHTYSLIMTTFPRSTMTTLRRGRPTCHKVFGEAIAILAGDGLQTRHMKYCRLRCSAASRVHIIEEMPAEPARLREWSRPGCGSGSRAQPNRVWQRSNTFTVQTAALISASVVSGGVYGGANPRWPASWSRSARSIGLAFRLWMSPTWPKISPTIWKAKPIDRPNDSSLAALVIGRRRRPPPWLPWRWSELRSWSGECIRRLPTRLVCSASRSTTGLRSFLTVPVPRAISSIMCTRSSGTAQGPVLHMPGLHPSPPKLRWPSKNFMQVGVPAYVVIVERGVVMDQGIGVQHFKCGARVFIPSGQRTRNHAAGSRKGIGAAACRRQICCAASLDDRKPDAGCRGAAASSAISHRPALLQNLIEHAGEYNKPCAAGTLVRNFDSDLTWFWFRLAFLPQNPNPQILDNLWIRNL